MYKHGEQCAYLHLKPLFWKCGATYTAGSTQAPFSGTKTNP